MDNKIGRGGNLSSKVVGLRNGEGFNECEYCPCKSGKLRLISDHFLVVCDECFKSVFNSDTNSIISATSTSIIVSHTNEETSEVTRKKYSRN